MKSEDDYTLLSLEKFQRKFRESTGRAYVLHPGDIRQEDGILYLPLYMAQWVECVQD